MQEKEKEIDKIKDRLNNRKDNIIKFAAVYSKMNEKAAAKAIEKIDSNIAAGILEEMEEKKIAKILEVLSEINVGKVKEITEIMTKRGSR